MSRFLAGMWYTFNKCWLLLLLLETPKSVLITLSPKNSAGRPPQQQQSGGSGKAGVDQECSSLSHPKDVGFFFSTSWPGSLT